MLSGKGEMKRILLGLFLLLAIFQWEVEGALALSTNFDYGIFSLYAGALDENFETEAVLSLRGGGELSLLNVVFVVDGYERYADVIRGFHERAMAFGLSDWRFAVLDYSGGNFALKNFDDDAVAFFDGEITAVDWGETESFSDEYLAGIEGRYTVAYLGPSGILVFGASSMPVQGPDSMTTDEKVSFIWKKTREEKSAESLAIFEIGNGTLADGSDYAFEYANQDISDMMMYLNGVALTRRKVTKTEDGFNRRFVMPNNAGLITLQYRENTEIGGVEYREVFMVDPNDHVRPEDVLELRFRVRLASPRDERIMSRETVGNLVCKRASYINKVGDVTSRKDLDCGDFGEEAVPTGVGDGNFGVFVSFALIGLGGFVWHLRRDK